MTGLRARQKADRGRRILESATTLFSREGYDNTRIEDIAEMAGVSVGTFYNYFENKGDILVAIVSMEVEEVLDAGERIVQDPPASVEAAMEKLIGQYYDHSLFYLSKQMWRTAMALSIQQPDTPFSRRYTELDHRLCKQVTSLVEILQRRGVVRAGLDCTAIGEMIFNNLNLMFIEFVKVSDMTVDQLKATVSRQNRPMAVLISV